MGSRGLARARRLVKKFGAARKRAFLAYLAQSGNQTLSAEKACVSRSWVQLHRSQDPGFDAACRAAIAEARERLIAEGLNGEGESVTAGNRPGRGWGFLDGAELVVRGTGGSGPGRRVQVGRARAGQWTARTEKRFLMALEGSCNVKAACAEVGKAASSAYAHRERWPAFARAWDEALEVGYVRLEAALVEHAGNLFSGFGREDGDEMEPIREMTAAQAIHLLHMHKGQVKGIGRRHERIDRRDPVAVAAKLKRLLDMKLRESMTDPAYREEARRQLEEQVREGERMEAMIGRRGR